MVGTAVSSPSYRVAGHSDCPTAPIPMCFTWEALDALLRSVGASRPETGAKGFGPLDRMGFDTIEFDESGSRQAGGAVYAPDAVWGQRRQEYWLRQSDDTAKLWTGDLHSHPGSFGFPSGKAGPGLGDLGYVEEVFRQNETMQYFLLPILTHTGTDAMPTIHPWVVSRDNPHQPLIAKLQVCDSTADFPLRVFNPEWAASIAAREPGSNDAERIQTALSKMNTGSASRYPWMLDFLAPLGSIALIAFLLGYRRLARRSSVADDRNHGQPDPSVYYLFEGRRKTDDETTS